LFCFWKWLFWCNISFKQSLKWNFFFCRRGSSNASRRDGMRLLFFLLFLLFKKLYFWFSSFSKWSRCCFCLGINLKLIEEGRFGSNKMRFVVSQNISFLPIHEALKLHQNHQMKRDSGHKRLISKYFQIETRAVQ
jgi:cysteate synthase